jgi:hypothetical protein
MKYAKGVCWVDDTRIPFVDGGDKDSAKPIGKITTGTKDNVRFNYTDDKTRYELPNKQSSLGRFTPSLLVCDDMLNDGKTYGNLFKQTRNKDTDGGTGNSIVRGHKEGESNGVFDNGTSSSRFYDLDKWFDKVINEIC